METLVNHVFGERDDARCECRGWCGRHECRPRSGTRGCTAPEGRECVATDYVSPACFGMIHPVSWLSARIHDEIDACFSLKTPLGETATAARCAAYAAERACRSVDPFELDVQKAHAARCREKAACADRAAQAELHEAVARWYEIDRVHARTRAAGTYWASTSGSEVVVLTPVVAPREPSFGTCETSDRVQRTIRVCQWCLRAHAYIEAARRGPTTEREALIDAGV